MEYKNNNQYEIRDLKEKCNDILEDLEFILSESHLNNKSLQELIKEYETNKKQLELKIKGFFKSVYRFVEEKRNEILEKFTFSYNQNLDKILEKGDKLNNRIENSKECKRKIISIMNGTLMNVDETFNEHYTLLREFNENSNFLNFDIDDIFFLSEEETKILKAFSNLADLKFKNKFIKLQKNIKIGKRKKKHIEIECEDFGNNYLDQKYSSNNNIMSNIKNELNSIKLEKKKNYENNNFYLNKQEQNFNGSLNIKENQYNEFNCDNDIFITHHNKNNFIPISKNPLFSKENLNKNSVNLMNEKRTINANYITDYIKMNNISDININTSRKHIKSFNNPEILETSDLINNDSLYFRHNHPNKNIKAPNVKQSFEFGRKNFQRNPINLDFKNNNFLNNDSRILYKYENGERRIYYETSNDINEIIVSKLFFI